MEMVTRGFCDRSNGMFVSCIGALNGWLVKIKKPSVKKDDIQDPGSYYSRKVSKDWKSLYNKVFLHM